MSSENLILKPNIFKSVILLLISIACVYIGYLIILEPNTKLDIILGWITLLFFGLGGVVVELIMMIPNSSYLRLTREGFEIKHLFRKSFTRWDEVSRFEVIDFSVNNRNKISIVAFNLSRKNKNSIIVAILRQIARQLLGFETHIPNNYGKKPEELAKLMNEWKERYAPNNTLNDQMANYNYNYNNMGNS